MNDVHRMDSIMFCPYCSRILFFDEKINDQYRNADISEGESFGVFADSGDDDDLNSIDDFDEGKDVINAEGDDDAVFEDDDAVFDDETAEEENELLNEEAAEFGENPEEFDENAEDEDEDDDMSDDSDEDEDDEDPDSDFDDDEDDDDEDDDE